MPAKPNERQYRSMRAALAPAEEDSEKRFDTDYYVEGYATTFNDPYVLWIDPWDGTEYREQIAPDALDGADMSDVILQYNHDGAVLARKSNGTLVCEVDDHGLFIAADLSKSAAARALAEEVQNELVVSMSWAFNVVEDAYDRENHLTTIQKVGKVYDVSAVSYPADPNTEISARNLLDGAIEQSHRESVRRKNALIKARAALAIAKE